MPVKRRHQKRRKGELPEQIREWFASGKDSFFHDDLPAWWEAWREPFLAEWVQHQPGTRPWAWWRHDAPEPRLRLGGTGTAKHDCLAHVRQFAFGLPSAGFLDRWTFDYFNGQARDIHGRLIANGYKPGDFSRGEPFDPDDPPRFETEAEYLARLGLLFDGEVARCQ
ncbi:hypothetical protein [Mesorhizobium sophorae]|uniref:hypothetical protein n=1 Tax=Mesorhizobium sophorae TaxID=1300294 RepID=UPI000BA2C45A|nr:hypothetical protein [Mesorhizobium sophorae]